MRFWWRRRRPRELGAAVTGIASGVVQVRPPVQPDLPAVPAAAAAGPRVELGFRDGSSASLDPGSEQARALEELARALTTPS
jgi:ferric-dicitrate binding protein FerR (iron transport regulator)